MLTISLFKLRTVAKRLLRDLTSTQTSNSVSRAKLNVENLGDRILPAVDWNAATATLNAGNQVLVARADEIEAAAFGANLPGVQENLAQAATFNRAFADAANVRLSTATSADQVASQLRRAGFTVRTASDNPDGSGNVLFATKTVRRAGVTATFSPGHVDGFNFWDRTVNGALSGSIRGSAQSVVVQMDFGIDVVNGQLKYWVSPTTSLVFSGLRGSGNASGTVQIGALSNVRVAGQYNFALDGRLQLRDTNGDGKIRVEELRGSRPATGSVNGQLNFAPTFTASVAGLVPLVYKGQYNATISNSNARVSEGLTRPDYQAFGRDVALAFLTRRPNIDLFGGAQRLLDTRVPFTNKTVGDFMRTDKVLTALATINPGITRSTPYDQVVAKLRNVGINFALTPDNANAVMDQLIRGNTVNLISQQIKGDNKLFSSNHEFLLATVNMAKIVSVDLYAYISQSLKLTYDVTAGFDSRGVYVGANTGLGLSGSVEAGFSGKLKVLGYSLLKASGGLSLDPELRVRVKDPTPGDGKVYLSEFAGRSIASLLATDFTLDLKGNLKAKLNLYFKEVTIAKHDWQLARLIDYSSDGQRPVTKSYRLAALAPDPTNVIEGTSGNDVFIVRRAGNDANRYEVILNGRLVSSGSWSSVKDLVLAGGNGNDTFRIETNDHASRGASVTALGDNGNDAFHTVGAGIFVGGAGSDYYTGSDVKFAQDFTIGGPNLTPSTRR